MWRPLVPSVVALVAAFVAAPGHGATPSLRQPQPAIDGVVFDDRNDNGQRDAGEPGLAWIAVSNQDTVVVTDGEGRYRLPGGGPGGVWFVSVPDGYRARGAFWHSRSESAGTADFALRALARSTRLTFLHASDTHIAPASLPRTQRLRAIIDSLRPSFVLITGDLVRDALRVSQQEASGYYTLFQQEAAQVRVPLWTVPGNHEIFGIERDKSGVAADHPLYGRAMYRRVRGPDYYSFTAGGVHFVGLNSVDIDDTRYYGHIDSLQLKWLERDLATIPARMPVVTFNHIPFFTAQESVSGYNDAPPAPSLITVRGETAYRHSVSNAREVIARMGTHPYPLALAGHIHTRESIRFAGVATRFDQAAAVVGGSGGGPLRFPSGVTLYEIRAGTVGDGRFIPLGLDGANPAR
jgi:predicted MPP superfamily phosphohydrolase